MDSHTERYAVLHAPRGTCSLTRWCLLALGCEGMSGTFRLPVFSCGSQGGEETSNVLPQGRVCEEKKYVATYGGTRPQSQQLGRQRQAEGTLQRVPGLPEVHVSVSKNKEEEGLELKLGLEAGQLQSMCKALGSMLVPKGGGRGPNKHLVSL